ncbi:hypothetical protein [Kitasatospora sp. NPDC097691]|uniref:hypothetical protein n=1 Tax=Kitasatospora sp. NPDC097691 TaxID=3157231 RepID=UPI0033209807
MAFSSGGRVGRRDVGQDAADEGDPVQDPPARRLAVRLAGLAQRSRVGVVAVLQPERVDDLVDAGLEVAVLAPVAGPLVVGVGDLAALVEADGAVQGALLGVARVDRERDDVPVLGDVGVGLDAVGHQGAAVRQAQRKDVGGLRLDDGEAGVGRDVPASGGVGSRG